MNPTQADALSFLNDVNKLSRKNKPRFIDRITGRHELCKLTREMINSEERFNEWDTKLRPQSVAWHWVWCIATNATLAIFEEIVPEVWTEARKMLDEALAEQKSIKSDARAKYFKDI